MFSRRNEKKYFLWRNKKNINTFGLKKKTKQKKTSLISRAMMRNQNLVAFIELIGDGTQTSFVLIISPNLWEGPLVLVLLLESVCHFLVCTISSEPVVGFLPNFHGYIIGT